jgi:hypothetical protein
VAEKAGGGAQANPSPVRVIGELPSHAHRHRWGNAGERYTLSEDEYSRRGRAETKVRGTHRVRGLPLDQHDPPHRPAADALDPGEQFCLGSKSAAAVVTGNERGSGAACCLATGACISWRTSLAGRAMLLRRLGYISAVQRCGWR